MEREKHLCANVDLYAAPVFTMLEFPPELNTPIFRRLARRRLVRARGRATRQQPLDSAAFALHRTGDAPVQRGYRLTAQSLSGSVLSCAGQRIWQAG